MKKEQTINDEGLNETWNWISNKSKGSLPLSNINFDKKKKKKKIKNEKDWKVPLYGILEQKSHVTVIMQPFNEYKS